MTLPVATDRHVTWDAFGDFLRKMRRRRGLSQENLAKLLNCHRTYIYRLERGERHPSRLFLRLLLIISIPSSEELDLLRGFEQLRGSPDIALEQAV